MSARRLRPKATAALVVAPITVTDLTCAVVLGLEPRVFRELVVDARIPHARIGRGKDRSGHRVIVRVEDMLAAIDRIARRGDVGDEAPADSGDETPTPTVSGVDRVLALIGRERRRS
jgi:hypothetical protein